MSITITPADIGQTFACRRKGLRAEVTDWEEDESYCVSVCYSDGTTDTVQSDGRVKRDLESSHDLVRRIEHHTKDLRDEFAMFAPADIPNWFKHTPQPKSNWSEADSRARYFQWRYYYADQMMKAREAKP